MFVMVTEERIRDRAGERSFDRGRLYFAQGRVEDLSAAGTTAAATVTGSRSYDVYLELTGTGMVGECSCPQGMGGSFCKHCVATALAWLAREGPLEEPEPPEEITDERLREFLADQDRAWLVEELVRAAGASSMLRARLEIAAGADERVVLDTDRLRRHLTRAIDAARDGDDEWLDEAEAALSRVEELAEAGFARVAAELAEHAIDRIVPWQDEEGSYDLLIVAERIHRAACADGHPDPVALADRLVDQALATEELFLDALPGYATALGTAGLARYRERLERADGPAETVRRLRERLAEHEGGADALIALLTEAEPGEADVARIVTALIDEGRESEAAGWVRRNVDRFGDATVLRHLGADCLVRAGDRRGAVELLWPAFIGLPTLDGYQALAEAGGELWPGWRAHALSRLRETLAQPGGRFDVMVEILLWEGDADGAWQAAQEDGVTAELLLRAARERGRTHPADAIPILLDAADWEIETKKRWAYSRAAQFLSEAQLLAERCGERDDFVRHMRALRARHKAKSALREQLDQARLP